MDARQMIIENSKEIARFVKTEQYRISRELMKERYNQSKSVKEMADRLGLTFKEYVGLEYGDENISVEEYNKVLKKAKG